VYFHGGGFALKAAPYHKRLMQAYALGAFCKVVFADYRLTPKHTFPAAFEDCCAAFEWVYANSEKLGIDRDRISIGGDSAGGALAASVCMMLRDRSHPVKIRLQLLVYPVTDAQQNTDSMKRYTDTPLWNSRLNEKMWRMYLNGGEAKRLEFASPAEAKSFNDLPPAYIETAEFDCLHDEGVAFAESLRNGGVEVELFQTEGTVHGYDVVLDSDVTRASIKRRIDALKRSFQI
jgi:acetyl esterase/lipase